MVGESVVRLDDGQGSDLPPKERLGEDPEAPTYFENGTRRLRADQCGLGVGHERVGEERLARPRSGRTPRDFSFWSISSGLVGARGIGDSRPDEEAVLVLKPAQLLFDPAHDEHLRALQMEAHLDVVEAFERRPATLLHDRLHRLLADPREQLEQVEPPRDRRGFVEEAQVLRRVRADDLGERLGELGASARRELVVPDAASHVVDRRGGDPQDRYDRDPFSGGDPDARSGDELEELQLGFAERDDDRLAGVSALGRTTVRQVIEDAYVGLRGRSPRESSVVGHDLEEARDLGLVEDDALFREEQANLLRELGESVGDLDGERGVDERERLELGDEAVVRLGLEASEELGMLLGEHRLPRQRAARGLFGQQSLDLGERDRLGHLGAPERGVGAGEVDRMGDEDLALSSVEEFHLVGPGPPA